MIITVTLNTYDATYVYILYKETSTNMSKFVLITTPQNRYSLSICVLVFFINRACLSG